LQSVHGPTRIQHDVSG